MNQGKTIVVTGVASGIGAETSRVLRAQGAHVIGIDRMPTDNADVFMHADLGDAASIDTLIANLPKGVNGLANIAGVPPTAAAETVLRVNLYGVQRLTLGLIPKLADGASVVNLASLAGLGWANSVPQIKAALDLTLDDDVAAFCGAQGLNTSTEGRSYFLTKEALVVWSIRNRWTWRERNINMNCVSPGPVDTPILADFLETLGERAKASRALMDRYGEPSDVAPVVAFALSDAAKWFRGANLTVDGGLSGLALTNIHQL